MRTKMLIFSVLWVILRCLLLSALESEEDASEDVGDRMIQRLQTSVSEAGIGA